MYEEVKTGDHLREILQDRIISKCGMLKGSKETCVMIETVGGITMASCASVPLSP